MTRKFWNHPGTTSDYWSVDCEDIRETLSARLDGEDGRADAERLADAHLDRCGACAAWFDRAAAVTRRVRTSAAVAWPDVAESVLARVPPATGRRREPVRIALGVIGAAQCAAGSVLLAAQSATGFETGAWRLAVGVALVAVAVRRGSPDGLVPLLAAVVGVLALRYLAGDPGTGWSPVAVVSHLLDGVAFTLVLALRRTSPGVVTDR